jgi:hypothetical protein
LCREDLQSKFRDGHEELSACARHVADEPGSDGESQSGKLLYSAFQVEYLRSVVTTTSSGSDNTSGKSLSSEKLGRNANGSVGGENRALTPSLLPLESTRYQPNSDR